jgi:hypothetical protein
MVSAQIAARSQLRMPEKLPNEPVPGGEKRDGRERIEIGPIIISSRVSI